ncbi:MAG: hypothetical protein J7639_11100 [Paenibacillaceae bacterium]|nr:hypothetical protein [Paenibacillaceae bacterium]
MAQQISIRKRMSGLLADYVPTLRSWTTGPEHRMADPFETVYSENYASANAAVIYAAVYADGRDETHLREAADMLGRSAELLADREMVPFCRVFLLHYSLLALLLLPQEQRRSLGNRFAAQYSAYEDDCPTLNTNCAALQWGTEMMLESLGMRKANEAYLDQLLALIESSSTAAGFLNDDAHRAGEARDGMPIAYHLFVAFILAASLAVLAETGELLAALRERAQRVVGDAIVWLLNAMSVDGTVAMAGRSRYQAFSWGVAVALLCATEEPPGPLAERALDSWLPYRKTDGSYSCTPNRLPHEMRCGFESYTHVNMYNNLALTGIAVAALMLDRRQNGWPAPAATAGTVRLSAQNRFADPQSGYAFVREDDNFFGCTLRMHVRRYTPALQGFHYRVGSVQLPMAEADFRACGDIGARGAGDAIWEGYLLEDAAGRRAVPDSTRNADFRWLADGVYLTWEDDALVGAKTIRLLADGICWSYRLVPKRKFLSCVHYVPLLLHDGMHGARFTNQGTGRLGIGFAGNQFLLECRSARSIDVSLDRSLHSVSGVAANTAIGVSSAAAVEGVWEWSTMLRIAHGEEDA